MKKIFLAVLFVCFITLGFKASANTYGYGIPKPQNHERPTPGSTLEKLIKNNNGIYIGADSKEVYLTFDCGYENGYTIQILDALKATNTKAIFFITGHYLTSATNIVKRMVQDGHLIGNHAYHHKNFAKISHSEIKEELETLEVKYEQLIGTKISNYFRPPEGSISDDSAAYVSSLGYKTIYWSLAYVDWHKDKIHGKEYSYNNVISRVHNGAIVLMHTVSPDNAAALKDIITQLHQQGYKIKNIDCLI